MRIENNPVVDFRKSKRKDKGDILRLDTGTTDCCQKVGFGYQGNLRRGSKNPKYAKTRSKQKGSI